ncbi:MAG: T9SS type A sorting domain-containing protein [Bacteroidales bacterium]|nr:T9SS type A sorting domain-containing protein [Bacteroidales bacterium]
MPSQRESSETGITEPNVKQSLKLWPNPVSGMLHIQLPDAEKEVARITVCDLLGRVVLQKENLPKPEIEVSSLPNGMYLLQLQLSDGTNLTAKFVKD